MEEKKLDLKTIIGFGLIMLLLLRQRLKTKLNLSRSNWTKLKKRRYLKRPLQQ
jgi:hypothetical protein